MRSVTPEKKGGAGSALGARWTSALYVTNAIATCMHMRTS